MRMEKIDLKKQLKAVYKASAKPALVEVPPLNCLMIDGRGDPNSSPQFHQAMEALYGLSYTMKFASKKAGGPDWTVLGVEGLWWTDPQDHFRIDRPKDTWQWTALIVQPEVVTAKMLAQTARELFTKKGNPAITQVRLERLKEGLCAQVLHVGPYDGERPTIALLHEFIAAQGREPRGKHHEVYLSDPRRVPPQRLKTLLRQPVA
jgi:hypothetical protein